MSQDKNEIRLSGTMTAIVVLDEEINGVNYTANVVDQNVESVGGALNWNDGDGYESASACKWVNERVKMDGSDDDNGFFAVDSSVFENDPIGTIPNFIRALGIKYTKKTGSPDSLQIAVKGSSDTIVLCSLKVGEGIALPLNSDDGDGFAKGNIYIKQSGNDSSNYGSVTLALLGHDGV